MGPDNQGNYYEEVKDAEFANTCNKKYCNCKLRTSSDPLPSNDSGSPKIASEYSCVFGPDSRGDYLTKVVSAIVARDCTNCKCTELKKEEPTVSESNSEDSDSQTG